MRHLPSDKYNIAWFKLAEFVVRGEKERALGMYRLLIHSFDDRALAYQLEGDLLLAFKDIYAALACYQQAAALYQMHKKYIEAAAIYEHVHILDPENQEWLLQLLMLYKTVKREVRFEYCIEALCDIFLQKKEITKVEQLLHTETISATARGKIYRLLTFYALDNTLSHEYIMQYMIHTIDNFLLVEDSHYIQTFLAKLHVTDQHYYHQAIAYAQCDDTKVSQ